MAESTSIKAVLASTPPKLTVAFDGDHIQGTGAYLPRNTARPNPTFKFSSANVEQKYIVISFDLDAPFSSFPFMSPVVHLLRYKFVVSEGSDGDLRSDDAALCSWARPNPPPGAGPHRYAFLLYEQPDGFDPAVAPTTMQRPRFDIEAFEKKAGLGSVVAGDWFSSN